MCYLFTVSFTFNVLNQKNDAQHSDTFVNVSGSYFSIYYDIIVTWYTFMRITYDWLYQMSDRLQLFSEDWVLVVRKAGHIIPPTGHDQWEIKMTGLQICKFIYYTQTWSSCCLFASHMHFSQPPNHSLHLHNSTRTHQKDHLYPSSVTYIPTH